MKVIFVVRKIRRLIAFNGSPVSGGIHPQIMQISALSR